MFYDCNFDRCRLVLIKLLFMLPALVCNLLSHFDSKLVWFCSSHSGFIEICHLYGFNGFNMTNYNLIFASIWLILNLNQTKSEMNAIKINCKTVIWLEDDQMLYQNSGWWIAETVLLLTTMTTISKRKFSFKLVERKS